MRTSEIYKTKGVEKMTNKEMFLFGMAYIADKYGIEFDDSEYEELGMVNLNGVISEGCYADVKELAMDLRLIDKEHECKMDCTRDCGISFFFDECWDRRVGNKEFGATICKWYDKVA